jgi:hypothetical protein
MLCKLQVAAACAASGAWHSRDFVLNVGGHAFAPGHEHDLDSVDANLGGAACANCPWRRPVQARDLSSFCDVCPETGLPVSMMQTGRRISTRVDMGAAQDINGCSVHLCGSGSSHC